MMENCARAAAAAALAATVAACAYDKVTKTVLPEHDLVISNVRDTGNGATDAHVVTTITARQSDPKIILKSETTVLEGPLHPAARAVLGGAAQGAAAGGTAAAVLKDPIADAVKDGTAQTDIRVELPAPPVPR